MKGPKRSLDVPKIVNAVLELLAEDPAAVPTLRGVAAHLGVRPNTLYTYVPDRAALEGAVVEHLLDLAGPGVLTGGAPWRERITGYALRLRAELLARPGAVPFFLSGPMTGPSAALVGEGLLAAFTEAGLPAADGARAAYAVMVHVLGSAAMAAADLPGPEVSPAEAVRTRRAALAAGPPRIAAVADVAAAWNSVEQFEWGINRLIDGCVPSLR
ncbi:TetR/AcrR family transcriptional regulator C-terminal domain-containing protein [Planomonospora sp. ID82291]|uniref:TetR/AcrR family transcriptional regulator C-terminal domain-containing protein n=1 Tax=Planomonospora sp. ID82291 TaxID=2738136 RepID=UPI0018C43E7F|nr:TetR/AcrR family transcriptional regulator C-terminal domain-containing protein [Planomonospora sp. ID82291]MBG0817612.1 TetR/AcrR family transcriptional regulator C-terminal domain-containing protein [Planomonospora sp. ID82291]